MVEKRDDVVRPAVQQRAAAWAEPVKLRASMHIARPENLGVASELWRYNRLDVPRYSRSTAGTAGTAGTARNALTEAWAEVHQRYISGTAGTAGTADGTA